MQLVPVSSSALRVGTTVPFSLRDAQGKLLLAAGSVIDSETMRKQLLDRGLYVDFVESENFQKALAGKVDAMLRQNASLGTIAKAHVEAPAQGGEGAQAARKPVDPVVAWQGFGLRAGSLLHDPQPQDYVTRLQRLDLDIQELLQHDADGALLLLIQIATGEVHQYSVHHSMLVSVVCELAARELSDWPPHWRSPLRCAALTMNIAMTSLQNQLALQDGGLSPRQSSQVSNHASAGAAQLATLGVTDPLWLGAVAHHHDAAPGPLDTLPAERRLARLVQRADIFTARLSPRKARPAQSATAAAKATYLDEQQRPDEAGAAIIKAMGLYPPGTYVQLASGEVAVVLRRGLRANEPRVASIVGRSGTPLGEPTVRDTRLRAYEVKSSVAPKDVRVRFPLPRLLQLAS